MLKLKSFYSDGALFLHSSVLELRGVTEKDTPLTAEICKDGEAFSKASATSDADGSFVISLNTPPASFDTYTVTVRTATDEYSFERVVFGELWLASGQSNMQMSNSQQPEWETRMKKIISERVIRSYHPAKIPTYENFPIDPVTEAGGEWKDSQSPETFALVSALATEFSVALTDLFAAEGKQIPIGFIGTNYGGTSITTWIPDSVFAKNEKFAYKRQNRETWNNTNGVNFQQPSSQYNHMVHPLIGIKVRGMLWYQGENDTRNEEKEHIYSDMLIALHKHYKELFAADDIFPCICSQIFPWSYDPATPECKTGYINRSFSELSRKYPHDFSFVPVCDLPPIWTYHLKNGPIHPAHKYALGNRFARLVKNVCYTDSSEVQKCAATLSDIEQRGSVLRLKFSSVGSGLEIKGRNVKCLYVRSERGVYVSAKAKIVSECELDVWHPYVENPKHVAYAVSSGEIGANLFAGEFPVAPFATEFTDEYGGMKIAVKPWLSNEYDNDFIYEEKGAQESKRSFSLPIFYPCTDSEICFDSLYQRSGRALNIWGEGDVFGAYVLVRRYRPIDLYNYSELQMSVYNSAELDSFITLYYKEEDGSTATVKIVGTVKESLDFGWERVSFDLSGLKKGEITRLDFSFTNKESRTRVANIDELLLVPKN